MENLKKIMLVPRNLRNDFIGYKYAIESQNSEEAGIVINGLLSVKEIKDIGINSSNVGYFVNTIYLKQNEDMSVGEFTTLIDNQEEKQKFINHFKNKYKLSEETVMESKTLFFDLCDVYQGIRQFAL